MNDPAAGTLAQGRQLNSVGRYADALPLLGQAIAARPQAAEPHCEMAFTLLHLGRYPDALREVDAAASLEPEDERSYRLRSIILDRLGRTKESLAAAEIAARLAPQLPSALYTLGCAQLDMKRNGAAQATSDELLRLAPAWALSHVFAGQVAVRKKRWKDAEAANRRALQLEPTLQVALNNLGVALQGQRRSKEALEVYQRAAQLDPNDPIAKANIVRLVRPVSGLGFALDLIRMILIPWTIPFILIRLTIQFIRSGRRRAQLRPGAQLYYDRAWGGSAQLLKRVLLATCVFILGVAAIIYLQARGWAFVATGIPMSVLILLCLGIALSRFLRTLPAELRRWWRARTGPRVYPKD